jgi:hypothetical protein
LLPKDHLPRHVLCFVGSAEIIVDILENGDVALSDRARPLRGNPKKVDINKALAAAKTRYYEIVEEWKAMHV